MTLSYVEMTAASCMCWHSGTEEGNGGAGGIGQCHLVFRVPNTLVGRSPWTARDAPVPLFEVQ